MRAFAERGLRHPAGAGRRFAASRPGTRFGTAGRCSLRLPEVDFIDDEAGKPVGIQRHIGRRPILAFGNSDGDFEMLEWTTSGPGPRLGLIVHHDDAEREFAYDRESHIGRLARGLDEAPARGWTSREHEGRLADRLEGAAGSDAPLTGFLRRSSGPLLNRPRRRPDH